MRLAWIGFLVVGLAGFGAFDSAVARWSLRIGWIMCTSGVVWIIGRAAQKAIDHLEGAASSGA
jgi:4-hydroxybenzoate polyprenyltransferase